MNKLVMSIIIGLFCLSCQPDMRTPEQKTSDDFKQYLPNEAKNIKRVGGNWITYSLELDGKNYKFLYHGYGVQRSSFASESNTLLEVESD